jgi:hypothetical protein
MDRQALTYFVSKKEYGPQNGKNIVGAIAAWA